MTFDELKSVIDSMECREKSATSLHEAPSIMLIGGDLIESVSDLQDLGRGLACVWSHPYKTRGWHVVFAPASVLSVQGKMKA